MPAVWVNSKTLWIPAKAGMKGSEEVGPSVGWVHYSYGFRYLPSDSIG